MRWSNTMCKVGLKQQRFKPEPILVALYFYCLMLSISRNFFWFCSSLFLLLNVVNLISFGLWLNNVTVNILFNKLNIL